MKSDNGRYDKTTTKQNKQTNKKNQFSQTKITAAAYDSIVFCVKILLIVIDTNRFDDISTHSN